jgi:hypothetical protein
MADFDLFAGYETAMAAIKEIDEHLDAMGDAKSAGKRAHVNTLVTAQADGVKNLVEQLSGRLNDAEPEVVVGFVTGLLRSLKTVFDPKITAYVEEWAKTNIPDDTPAVTLSDEEIKDIESKRAGYYKAVKTLRELAVQLMFVSADELDSKLPMARKRTGSRGARGPQVWSVYNYSVNGTEVSDETSLTDIAKAAGFATRKELTDLIATKMGEGWKKGHNFEVTLEDGTVIEGEYPSNVPVTEDDSEEDVTEAVEVE